LAARSGRATPDEGLPDPPGTSASVSDYLTVQREARRDVYLRRAWEHFRDQEYQRALATFRLAETIVVGGSEAQRGAIGAALTSEQYMVAASMLRRLLRDDPELFTHKDSLRSRFASPDAYRETANRIRDNAERADASVPARALYAFLLWQDGDWQGIDHVHARGLAGAIAEAEPNGAYSTMLRLMLDAEAAVAGDDAKKP